MRNRRCSLRLLDRAMSSVHLGPSILIWVNSLAAREQPRVGLPLEDGEDEPAPKRRRVESLAELHDGVVLSEIVASV